MEILRTKDIRISPYNRITFLQKHFEYIETTNLLQKDYQKEL